MLRDRNGLGEVAISLGVDSGTSDALGDAGLDMVVGGRCPRVVYFHTG